VDAELQARQANGKSIFFRVKTLRHFAPVILLLAGFVTIWCAPLTLSTRFAVLGGVAVFSTALLLGQNLPLQNVVGLLATTMLIGLAQLLFQFAFQISTPRLFGIENSSSLAFLFFWTTALLNSREAAKWLLQKFRSSKNFGVWLMVLGSFLLTIFDANFFESARFFAKDFTWAAISLIAIVPLSINKRHKISEPDFQPAFILALLWIFHRAIASSH
jgi:hypothetical protein